jgi:diguanylate cyclase (GGDEF)-like protein
MAWVFAPGIDEGSIMTEEKSQSVRVLMVEDVVSDAELTLLHLKMAGLQCVSKRVETETGLRDALREFAPDIILSDFSLPQFDGLGALKIAHDMAQDVPFIFVSGTMGEELAITALHSGAVDYILKAKLARLAPAIRRALKDVAALNERRADQARINRLDRVLRMLSGVNALLIRVRERKELLSEICRLAVAVGGYATSIVYYKAPGAPAPQMLGCSGEDEGVGTALRKAVSESPESGLSVVDHVIKTGNVFVCTDTSDAEGMRSLQASMRQARLRSLVALPLFVDKTALGVLVLAARGLVTLSKEELQMLREVSGNVSFAMQYLQKDSTVRFLSHFDPQTGLAKRSLFCERLSRLVAGATKPRSRYAVCVIDIERLSVINDSFGRRIGDLLLQHVADRIKRRFQQSEHIGHFGGGTFAFIRDLGKHTIDETLAAAREHGAALFGEPFIIEQREIPVAVRSGLVTHPEHGKDANSLVQNAEAALRNARASGDRQIYYSEKTNSETVGRLTLEHKLRLALDREQFELHYQPKVNVISRRIEGVEALIRWRDPAAGLISPAGFLPVLEASGLMAEVGDWVIRRAALDCQRWMSSGLAPLRVAVNITPNQLRLPDFVESFLNVLAGWSTPQAGLDIEITEGALHEDLAAEVGKLKLLRAAGVRVAIDDFGTGYSSLGRLAKLPIDTLKIDRTFTREVPQDQVGRMLVKTIITLARALRLTTVAEGVETQDQLDFMWHMGCDQSQGYLHSHPLPSSEFALLLEHGRGNLVRPPESSADSVPKDNQGRR